MESIHKENVKERFVSGNSDTKTVNNFKISKHNVNSRLLHKLENVNCIYTNADCLTNKISELRLQVKNHNPQIVGITEVKPKNFRYQLSNSEIALEGYELFGSNLQNKTGRGVCIYIQTTLQANPVEFKTNFEESVWASIKLVDGDELLIGCIYRSSSGNDTNNENLLKLLLEINKAKYSHLLIMGDFNFEKINWDTWSTPSNESGIDFKFIECIRDSFLFQHVNKPTRARIDHEPHILDLVLTNEEGMISNIEHLSPLSDDSLLLLIVIFSRQRKSEILL